MGCEGGDEEGMSCFSGSVCESELWGADEVAVDAVTGRLNARNAIHLRFDATTAAAGQ